MKSMACFAYANDDRDLWFSHFRFNGLFKADLCSDNIKLVSKFPNSDISAEGLHYCCKKHEEKLYFFPQKAKGIDIYDISKEEFCQVELQFTENQKDMTIIEVFDYTDNTCVLVPRFKSTPMLFFSLEKKEIVESIQLVKANEYCKENTRDLMLYACKVRSTLYFPLKDTNCIGTYDLNKRKEKVYILEGLNQIIGDVEFDGTNFWINADKGIYQWNPLTNALKYVCDCNEQREQWIEQFILYQNKLICIPHWLGDIKIIDIDTLDQTNITIDVSKLHGNIDTPWRDVKNSFVWRDNLVILPVKYSETIFIDLKENLVSFKRYLAEELIEVLGKVGVKEQNEDDFREYIDSILQNKCKNSICDNGEGSKIWKAISGNN